MQVRFRIGPVPLRDDDIALDALRPRRCGRQLAAVDAIGPVGEHRERALAPHLIEAAAHLRAGLSRLNAAIPRGPRRAERSKRFRNLARRLVAKLMARPATARLEIPDPLGLALHVRRDAVTTRRIARELALLGNTNHREPEAGGIVLGGRTRIRRDNRSEVERFSRRRLRFLRVDEAVAAHPDVVVRARQIRQQIASAIVGDDDLHVLRREVGRLGDHPDARFRPLLARNDAADVVVVDADRVSRLTRLDVDMRRCHEPRTPHDHRRRAQHSRRRHGSTPSCRCRFCH